MLVGRLLSQLAGPSVSFYCHWAKSTSIQSRAFWILKLPIFFSFIQIGCMQCCIVEDGLDLLILLPPLPHSAEIIGEHYHGRLRRITFPGISLKRWSFKNGFCEIPSQLTLVHVETPWLTKLHPSWLCLEHHPICKSVMVAGEKMPLFSAAVSWFQHKSPVSHLSKQGRLLQREKE